MARAVLTGVVSGATSLLVLAGAGAGAGIVLAGAGAGGSAAAAPLPPERFGAVAPTGPTDVAAAPHPPASASTDTAGTRADCGATVPRAFMS